MYPTYRAPQTYDQRFPFLPFLPFLAGLAVSPLLYGPRPYYGPRPLLAAIMASFFCTV
jgi:hypothetical protein